MLSTFTIALREGLEAALIIGILLAYIVKTDRRHLMPALWGGVAVAIIASFALGGFLSFTSRELTPRGEEFFTGTTSFLAVGLVTAMVFWMKATARSLRDDLHGKVENSLVGGPIALALTAFLAVAREGLETSLFVYTNFKSVGAASAPSIGLILGLGFSIALGILIYNRSVTLNLGKFFRWTGVALLIVAAGVLSNAIQEYQALGRLPGDQSFAWDVTSWMAPHSLLASFLGGAIGFDTTTSWLQLIIWIVFLGSTLYFYLKTGAARNISPRNAALSGTRD